MRVTSKGQVTIPIQSFAGRCRRIAIREQLGIRPDTEVTFEIVGDAVQIRRAPGGGARGRSVIERLQASPWTGPSTEDLMALTRS